MAQPLPPPENKREELHELLVEVLGSRNVYFQPDENISMDYPCIVYQRDYAQSIFANNGPYRFTKRYQVTAIDRDPDSEISERLAALPLCTFNRFFTANDLNHDIYQLYY